MNETTPGTDAKLAIIVHSFADGGGGAERVAANLAHYYAGQGQEVDLVVFNSDGAFASLLGDKLNLVDLQVNAKRLWPYRPGTWLALARYFKNEQPEYVLSSIRHINIAVGLSAYLKKPRRLIFREINTQGGVSNRKPIARFFYRFLMTLSYRKADGIIANSNDTRDDLLRYGIVPESKITVIQNPVLRSDYKEFAGREISEPWLNDSSLRVVLGVGRLTHQKNFPLLVRAFSRVYEQDQRARLIILGHGEEHSTLNALIDELNLKQVAKIMGFQSNIFPYFKKASVFALCSLWEGFGNVLVESLAVGTPVVSMDCPGGPRTILQDGQFGRLVKAGDLDGFATAIAELLKRPAFNPDDLVQRSEAFMVDTVAKEYLAVINNTFQQVNKTNSAMLENRERTKIFKD